MSQQQAASTMDSSPLPASVEVLIVGFGPVGAALALLLARQGVRVLIVDKESEMVRIPRAIGLDNEALRILQMAGLPDDAFTKRPAHELNMSSRLGGRFLSVQIAGVIDTHAKFISFYQPDLEAALRRHLQRHDHVMCCQSTEFLDFSETQDGVRVQLRDSAGTTHQVAARYLVGADGASSPVRERLGLEFGGRSYVEDWLIVDVRNPPQRTANPGFICNPERPLVMIPAPDGRQRWEFMLHPGESREEMLAPDSIRRLLAPWGPPEDFEIERKAVYRFHARCCRQFYKGRVFLVGDAAHITPPFIGQGLVTGLRDVANLGWKLAWVLRGQASANILDSYSQERRPHAQAMINLATYVGAFVMPRTRLRAVFSHGLMRLLRMLPAVRRFFDELKIKPKNVYRRGLFLPGRSRLQRGTWLPQCWLRDSQGSIHRSDEALGDGLSLVSFGPDPHRLLSDDEITAWKEQGGQLVQIVMNHQVEDRGAAAWEDVTGSLVGDIPYGWAAVVRPDRIVLTDGPGCTAGRLIQDARALLGPPRQIESVSLISAVRS